MDSSDDNHICFIAFLLSCGGTSEPGAGSGSNKIHKSLRSLKRVDIGGSSSGESRGGGNMDM